MALFDFLSVSKTLKDFAEQLSSIRGQIESTQREIEDIEFAPAAPVDVVAALRIWATRQEERYLAHLKNYLERLSSRASILSDEAEVRKLFDYGAFLQEPMMAKMSLDAQLCGLLGADRFADLMAEKLALMNMPEPGLPLNQRQNQINEIKAKQDKLKAKERDLIKSADSAGLQVS